MDRTQVVACLIAAACLAGCSHTVRPVVVGSKNFTEQVLLGEIVARHVENRLHIPVDRRLNLGGTLLAHESLVSGQIDLYPEYTGTALTNILKLPPSSEPEIVYERVRREYEERFHLVWLPPLGFNDSFAMVVRGPDARAHKLQTLSDAERYPPGWVLGAGYEFLTRPDGFPSLMRTYKLPLKGGPRTMDLGLLYRALEQKQIDIAAGNTTDGLLTTLDVTLLRDDRGAFPPYQAALVVRPAALDAHPGLKEALAALSGKFTDAVMRRLNYQVDGLHRPVPQVAREFLEK